GTDDNDAPRAGSCLKLGFRTVIVNARAEVKAGKQQEENDGIGHKQMPGNENGGARLQDKREDIKQHTACSNRFPYRDDVGNPGMPKGALAYSKQLKCHASNHERERK